MSVRRVAIASAVAAAVIVASVALTAHPAGWASAWANATNATIHRAHASVADSTRPSAVALRSTGMPSGAGVLSARVGDGVCATNFTASAIVVTAAPNGVTPRHRESAAIDASYRDLTAPFRQGRFDAYFAYAGTRPTWVVEVGELTYPWDAGGVLHQPVVSLHHVVEFIDDRTLTSYETFGCT